MKNSISIKIFLIYVLLVILSFGIVALPGTWFVGHETKHQLATQMYKLANDFSSHNSFSSDSVDELLSELSPQLEALHLVSNCDVWILRADGTLIYKNGELSSLSLNTPTDFSATDATNGYYLWGNFYDTLPERTLSVFAPLHEDYNLCGYIVLHLPYQSVVESRENSTSYLYLLLFVMSALFLLLPISFLHLVQRPVLALNQAAEEYASGNLSYEISVKTQDEFGMLSQTLSYMAKRLSDMRDDQHRFIANVSHDFRSPLTSIKGYIEALLDGTIPEQLYPKYLNIVLDETNRLNKLTQNLLTLNNLDSQGYYLDCTQFDINHIIKKILATFEGTCTAKGITFDLLFAYPSQPVWADMERIQQVLYNLIDNAIKFSPPDSCIEISTHVRNEKVFCSVKDYGIGIAPENLSRIWERFYKTDPSRGRDKKGTGLGLSIAKDIIQAHHQTIDVISTPGVGTQFIFTLPLSKPSE